MEEEAKQAVVNIEGGKLTKKGFKYAVEVEKKRLLS